MAFPAYSQLRTGHGGDPNRNWAAYMAIVETFATEAVRTAVAYAALHDEAEIGLPALTSGLAYQAFSVNGCGTVCSQAYDRMCGVLPLEAPDGPETDTETFFKNEMARQCDIAGRAQTSDERHLWLQSLARRVFDNGLACETGDSDAEIGEDASGDSSEDESAEEGIEETIEAFKQDVERCRERLEDASNSNSTLISIVLGVLDNLIVPPT